MNVLDYLHVIFFGIVEGITEWLPVSSTGHMMLFNSLWPLNVSPEFYDTFLVVIQLGAILAVIAAFFKRLNPFSFRKSSAEKRATWRLWLLIIVGSIPAAIVGIALDKWIEAHIMNDASLSYKVVAGALIVYGFIFIIMELILKRRIANSAVVRGKHARYLARGLVQGTQAPHQRVRPALTGKGAVSRRTMRLDREKLLARQTELLHPFARFRLISKHPVQCTILPSLLPV